MRILAQRDKNTFFNNQTDMNEHKNKTRRLTTDEVSSFRENWMNCLPGNISNLFYQKDLKKGIQRISYFSLNFNKKDISDIETFRDTYQKDCIIRIIMGCEKDEHQNDIFTPVFELTYQGVVNQIVQDPLFFSQTPHFSTYSPRPSLNPILNLAELQLPDSPIDSLTEITGGVADLFHKKWSEFSDAELADAFTGITHMTSSSNRAISIEEEAQQFLTSKRVRSYVFSKADTSIILQYILQQSSGQPIYMYMGAGLTVRFTHPFNYRPMILLPDRPSGMPEDAEWPEDPDAGTYFERSRPCPPYCEDDDGEG